MYLSLLRLNPRSRRAATEAGRPYELHRSLMRAFPSHDEGGPGRVLFRLDTDPETGGISVLVQSQKKPNWDLLRRAGDVLSEDPACKVFDPNLARGATLYFRLRANPTKRNTASGKRIGLMKEEEQHDWLSRKAKSGGFEVLTAVVIPEGVTRDAYTDQSSSSQSLSLLSVRFDGVLRVTDPASFRTSLEQGIGSGKGLGFGLLSVAPVRD